MSIFNQENFIKVWSFASEAHKNQNMPGNDLPYLTHIGSVVMELLAVADTIENIDLAISCAILHDTIEDTKVTYDEILSNFSKDVADGVLSLTKEIGLGTKQEQMIDSLNRIMKQPKSIKVVKLADRISNLKEPPSYWSSVKIQAYKEESEMILKVLKGSNIFLEQRLEKKIEIYNYFI